MPDPKKGGLLCGSFSWEKHHFLGCELQAAQMGERAPLLLISEAGGKMDSLKKKKKTALWTHSFWRCQGMGTDKGAGRELSRSEQNLCLPLPGFSKGYNVALSHSRE